MTCNRGDIISGFESEHLFRMYISNTCPTSNTIQHSDHLRTMTACVYSRFISPLHTAIASLTMSIRTSKTSSSSTSTANSGAGLYSFTYLYTIYIYIL